MRGWILVASLGLGCARDNAAFDMATRDVGGDGTGVGTSGDPSGVGSVGTSEASSGDGVGGTLATTGPSDPETTGEDTTGGPAACGAGLSDGLELLFGDPNVIGACPTSVGIWARLDLVSSEDPVFLSCAAGCDSCTTAHAFAISAFDFGTALPVDASTCLRLETSTPLGEASGLCRWGALTVHDPVTYAPYFAAIAQDSPPTTAAASYLGTAIPSPESTTSCACARLDSDVCCPGATEDVKFFAYPFDGTYIGPGDSALLELPGPAGLPLRFRPFQAQSVPTCDGSNVQASWAVYADP